MKVHRRETKLGKAFRIATAALGLALLAGCASAPQEPSFADITFAHLPPIVLNVANIDIRTDYRPSEEKPYIDRELPVDLTETVAGWARDRLKAGGTSGTATFIVEESSMKEVDLKKTEGITGLFTTDQAQKYEGVIKVLVHAENPATGQEGRTEVNASRTQTVAEDATLNDRARTWYGMEDALVKDMNKRLEEGIRRNLAPLVLN